jgi:hypothetical protein
VCLTSRRNQPPLALRCNPRRESAVAQLFSLGHIYMSGVSVILSVSITHHDYGIIPMWVGYVVLALAVGGFVMFKLFMKK